MAYSKFRLLKLSKKVLENRKLTPSEIDYLLSFEKVSKEDLLVTVIKTIALPLSLAFGFFYTVYPKEFEIVAANLPSWTNLSPSLLAGMDYLWNILAEPVGKPNILYHLPNLILYSFGIFGVKKLVEALDKHSWLDKVYSSQKLLEEKITRGDLNLSMEKGHSVLFVGKGDYIGHQFVSTHTPEETVTISESKPSFTKIWNYYSADTIYEDLKEVIEKSDGESSGEYFFFPVKDDQVFLPAPTAYDLSPHKLDILCQNIRTIEKEEDWATKRIIIVGDRFHQSLVVSEDQKKVLPHSKDIISLESISKKYPKVTLLDPTEIVLKKILEISEGRKIVFRATKEGIKEYKDRFYRRLKLLGYKHTPKKAGILTIGYDLFEDQTEQQMLAKLIDDYYPVVLSKTVHDALIRNGYKKSEFIFVPELVLEEVSKIAAQQ